MRLTRPERMLTSVWHYCQMGTAQPSASGGIPPVLQIDELHEQFYSTGCDDGGCSSAG